MVTEASTRATVAALLSVESVVVLDSTASAYGDAKYMYLPVALATVKLGMVMVRIQAALPFRSGVATGPVNTGAPAVTNAVYRALSGVGARGVLQATTHAASVANPGVTEYVYVNVGLLVMEKSVAVKSTQGMLT